MNCPACGSPYQPGDRFCGTCGERLDGIVPSNGMASTQTTTAPDILSGAPPAASMPPPPRAQPPAHQSAINQPAYQQPVVAAPAPVPPAAGGAPCPVCGAPLARDAVRCAVCNFEPGASVVAAGGLAAAPRVGGVQPDSGSAPRVCPTHGPLDPSWTRCPYCLKEGREGRLPSGAVGLAPPGSMASPPIMDAPALSGGVAPPRMEPAESVVPSTPPNDAPEPVRPPVPAPRAGIDQPRSSVGATFAIRRRARVLAYLIEKAGDEVGRVHQLDDDVTDIGRDPRNHVVLNDVVISGFHARVERGPDGGFVVQDRNSTNGSFLNDEQLTTSRRIEENDELRMGNTVLVLKVVE